MEWLYRNLQYFSDDQVFTLLTEVTEYTFSNLPVNLQKDIKRVFFEIDSETSQSSIDAIYNCLIDAIIYDEEIVVKRVDQGADFTYTVTADASSFTGMVIVAREHGTGQIVSLPDEQVNASGDNVLNMQNFPLQGGNFYKIRIQIEEPDSEGEASGQALTEIDSFYVIVGKNIDVSDAPVTSTKPESAPVVSGLEKTHNSVTFNWSLVTGATFYEYKLNNGAWQPLTASPFSDSTLEPETAYDLRTRAGNSAGVSDPGGPVSFTTDASPVQSVPQSSPQISNVSIGQTSITFDWTPPSDGETHQYRLNKAGAQVLPESPATLDELDPNTDYELQTRSENSFGKGDWQTVLNFTTDAATAPTSAPSITSIDEGLFEITVNFDGVPDATSYRVEVTVAGNTTSVTGAESPITIGSLPEFTDGAARVYAVNSGGEGPVSADVNFKTESRVKDQPVVSDVTADQAQNEVNFTFGAVDHATSYQYRVDQGPPIDIPAGDLVAAVSGLEESSNRQFEVRGTNEYGAEHGHGPWSNPTTFDFDVTPPDISDFTITVESITTSGFTLSVVKATDSLAANDQLVYEYHEGSSLPDVSTVAGLKSKTPVDSGVDQNTFVVTGKTHDTEYFVNIAVLDPSGNLRFYSAISVTTAFDPNADIAEPLDTPVNKTLDAQNVTNETADIVFEKSTGTNSATFEYRLYKGGLTALSSVDTIESQTLVDSGTDVGSLQLTGTGGEFVEFNVVVEDTTNGYKQIYEPGDLLFPEQEVTLVEIYDRDPDGLQNPQPIATSPNDGVIQLSTQKEAVTLYARTDATEGADDTVTFSLSDPLGLTFGQSNGYEATIANPGNDPGEVVDVIATSNFDSFFKAVLRVELFDDAPVDNTESTTFEVETT